MAKEWTDEEVSAEIANAVRIVREDKFEAFVRSKVGTNSGDAGNPNDASGNSGNGNTGASGDGNPTPKRSLWWGDSE